MKYYKLIRVLFLAYFLSSCSATYTKRNFQELDDGFQISVLNSSYEIKNDTILTTGRYKLLDLFNLSPKIVDTVNLQLNDNGALIVSFRENVKGIERKQVITYKGKFKSKRAYEITLVKERVQVPPLIPIIYGKAHIDKISIKLMKNGDIALKNYFRKDGNIFVLGAGSSYKSKSFYRKLN